MVAELLMEQPGLRGIIRRVQPMAHTPIGAIRVNLLDRDLGFRTEAIWTPGSPGSTCPGRRRWTKRRGAGEQAG